MRLNKGKEKLMEPSKFSAAELSKLSLADLNRLAKRVEAETARRATSTKKDVMREVQKLAAKAGIAIEELFGAPVKAAPAAKGRPGRKAGAKKAGGRKTVGEAKYKNPADQSQTWTGRGRKPQWVQDWLAQGKPLAELEIKA
ncbi:H-NS family nucleoid-associated regulatory protein [Niveibacterium terrae]|uniref:H-NS histone family protein n=1 Tax=Niveibacterium terrae TaxID=3373598 RepID=UPI003A91C20D